jgi:hypothetical protein
VTVPFKANADEWAKIRNILENTKTQKGPAKKGEANRVIYGIFIAQ